MEVCLTRNKSRTFSDLMRGQSFTFEEGSELLCLKIGNNDSYVFLSTGEVYTANLAAPVYDVDCHKVVPK